MRRLSIRCTVFISAFLLMASYAAAGNLSFSWGDDQRPESGPTVVQTKPNGPPAHAPAHGCRTKHQYRYFPDANVYHDDSSGLYFYLSGANWQVGASLPQNLNLRLGGSVSLEVDTDKPYIYNDRHRQQYPPGQLKKMQKAKSKPCPKGAGRK